MTRRASLVLLFAFVGLAAADEPIVTVQKDLYRKHAKPRTAAMGRIETVGPRFELMEWRGEETLDDVWDANASRWSTDNGQTWTDWVKQAATTNVKYGDQIVWEGGVCRQYDPASGRLVEMWLRQIAMEGKYNCFTYWRTSADAGRTWTAPRQLRYEAGADFDPADPRKPAFLTANQAHPGNNILVRSDGALVVCLAHTNAANDKDNAKRAWRMGAVCFIGQWDAKAKDYRWTAGTRTEVSPDVSSRGLMEPEVAELADGRILVVWRGSNTAKTPGRKWFAISTDGGRTLGVIQEWKYDDGTQFYSPSSYHRLVRHSVTKKLYWIGNICPMPPSGNSPRFPLVIAEVDEKIPAIRKKTVTNVDDRKAGQGPDVQFSNFSLYEDRQTHELVLLLTTYGQEADPKDWASADCYRYRLRLRPAK